MPIVDSRTYALDDSKKLLLYEWGYAISDFCYREAKLSKLFRIGCIVSGKGFMTVSGRSYELNAGDTYLIKPEKRYFYDSDKLEPMNKLWLHFQGEWGVKILKFYHIDQIDCFKGIDTSEIISEIHSLCIKTKDMDSELLHVNALFIKLIEHLAKGYYNFDEIKDAPQRLKLYIDIHCCEDITGEKLTALSGLSNDHMIRVFKKKYNVTPRQYLLDRKIELSKFYLELTDRSMEEISHILGFSDASHYSYTFNKKVGERPLKYRKERM